MDQKILTDSTPTFQHLEILFLCLSMQDFLDGSFKDLFSNLQKVANVKHAKTCIAALEYLEINTPKAIIVSDQGILDDANRPVLERVLSYLNSGGRVVIGLQFSTFAQWPDMDKFFSNDLGLSWKSGNYTKSTVQLNPTCAVPTDVILKPFASPPYLKALHIRGAHPREKILTPQFEEPEYDSNDERPRASKETLIAKHYVETQAVVVGTTVGKGFIAYLGDVNPGPETDGVIIALCGLRELD